MSSAVRVRRIILEAADLVHILNDRTPELVEPYFSLGDKPVFHSPHPSYLGDVPNIVTREEARFELGVGPDATVFLSFGAIQPYKGIEDLVAAAQQLDRDRPDLDWVLLVAGVARDKALVGRLGESQLLDGRLRFHPHKVPIEDIQYYFNAADYCVCPYRQSLNSGVAMLALTFGVPLIAPEAPAFVDLLSRGTGFGYKADEGGALSAALASAIGRDATEMRARALALAEDRHPEKASSQFFEALTARLPAAGPVD
jgi:glycosyltransferase involved in cell wall biosynthesis